MDDVSEDNILYSVFISQQQIVSRYLFSCTATMGQLRQLFFKTEFLFLAVFLIIIMWQHSSLNEHIYKKMWNGLVKLSLEETKILSQPFSSYCQVNDDRTSVTAIRGRRITMEDRYCLMADKEKGIFLYGVFDGHGGEWAADFAQKNLFLSLLNKLQQEDLKQTLTPPLISRIITEEILALDEQIIKTTKEKRDVSGSTALIAVIYKDVLLVANVGDSRGVLCDSRGATIPLSFDHKPQQLKELKRIKEAGGFIKFYGVWRVNGILATSRALGDFPLKENKYVIADPEILTFNLTDLDPQFIILATDGLWDTISNEEAVQHTKNYIQRSDHGTDFLVKLSYEKGSQDNISVIVVDLRNFTAQVSDLPPPNSSD